MENKMFKLFSTLIALTLVIAGCARPSGNVTSNISPNVTPPPAGANVTPPSTNITPPTTNITPPPADNATGNVTLPTLNITLPVNGANVSPGNITVAVNVTNFLVVDKQGQNIVGGEGHLHYYLDINAPTTPGQPAAPATGTWAHVANTTHTFTDVQPGTHTISVQLVNNDHTPVVPLVIATINITVTAANVTGANITPIRGR